MPSSLLFIIASLIWGSTFWAITQQLGEVAPSVSVAYRFGLASICLFIWCLWRKDSLRLPWKLHGWMVLQGFFTFALTCLCTYSSEQYLVSALVAVLFALMVIWSPITERIFFKKPLSWRIWSAALISITGVILLFFPALKSNWEDTHSGHDTHFLLGLGLALTATLASTFGNVVVVKVRQYSQNVLLTMAWAMAWGTVWVSLFAIANGEQWTLPSGINYWLSLIYLSLFGSVIAFACYFTLIHRIGAQKTVFIGVITPIISVLLSIQLENYHPGWIEWSGMVLCLGGVVWALRGEPKRT